MSTERWHLTYDDGNQEDTYVLRPSDQEINRCRMDVPDAAVALFHSSNGYEWDLVQEWAPLRAKR